MAISFANKYRPRIFGEVVGQTSIIKILENQITLQSFKQGYLFCGGAGTGKTTVARIFARAINEEKEVCSTCGEIQFKTPSGITCNNGHGGSDSRKSGKGEIIEIDAASNNGVDSIRELRESVKFKPIHGKYKVYIIDEVHMLSTGAFNALLKTLEEPPAHAVFILCTTDPQKVPATILSRVQRFDFMRMTTRQIKGRLEEIIRSENEEKISNEGGSQDAIHDFQWAEKEGISIIDIEDEVFEYISKLANGGMRNAISILDTCINYKQDLVLEDMLDILGATDHQDFIKICKGIMNTNKADLIEQIELIHLDGKDMKQFVKGLIEFVVDLRKLQLLDNFDYVSAPTIYENSMDNLLDMVEDGNENLDEWFKKLTELHNMIRYESNPKTLIQGWLLTI